MDIINIDFTKKKYTRLDVRFNRRELEIFNTGRYRVFLIPAEIGKAPLFDKIEQKNLLDILLIYFKVTQKELQRPDRNKRMVNIRMFITVYFRKYTQLSLAQIGSMLHRNHASIIHLLKRFEGEKLYEDTQATIKEIDQLLKLNKLV